MSNKLIDLNALSEYKDYSDLKYQDKLTAGTGISIDANNVISATGGGGGVTLPPAFAFNIQEPDFSATFSLDNAFSTAVSNQQFSNYKLGAKLSIGGTYPGTLYLAHADYMYDSSTATSSHHIAALFVGSTSKTATIQESNNAISAAYTALKAQIGNSHFIGFVNYSGLQTTTFVNASALQFTDCVPVSLFSGTANVQFSPGKLALFNNFYLTCKYVFESNGKYSVCLNVRNASASSTAWNYYYLTNTGSFSGTTTTSTAVSILGVVLLK